ncbi:MAG: hypothetical protein IJO43_04520 [Bacilli bacterium]|nr:hypothetical protein [Bacilli bacterium]
MDIDINEMFSEKNQTIFLNKLQMDLSNNNDALTLATKHIVMMEFAKVLSSLKKMYEKYSVDYDEEELKQLLSKTKNALLDDINAVIDDKFKNNDDYVEQSKGKEIRKTYLKQYHQHIDDNDNTFNENVLLAVQTNSEVNLYEDLVRLYPCASEEMQQELLQMINVDFSKRISTRVIQESKLRSMTLKNISEETYQKYLDLSRNSSVLGSGSKVKKKTDK